MGIALEISAIRLRFASWLAPELQVLEEHRKAQLRELREETSIIRRRIDAYDAERHDARAALAAIVSRATSNPNSTVKAMVRIAQDALNGKEQANG